MIHIAKDTCGVKQYQCVGIEEKIKKTLQITSDIVNYKGPTAKRGQKSPDNFKNLPTSYQYIINSTPYIDLSSVADITIGQCKDGGYDPFSGQGLVDWFLKIANANISPFGQYLNTLSDYSYDTQQKPGILLVTPALSKFNPTPIIAIPDYVSAATTTQATAASGNSFGMSRAGIGAMKSPCQLGFQINAWFVNGINRNPNNYTETTGSLQISINVQQGVIALGDQQINVNSYSTTKNVSGQASIAIYLILALRAQSDGTIQWAVKQWRVIVNSQSSIDNLSRQVRAVYIGGVKVYKDQSGSNALSVTQAVCSPLVLNDTVAQYASDMANNNKATLFVFAKRAGKNQYQWVPVEDCS